MRRFTNFSWPETPYGADKRPFGRKMHLLTGVAVQWAEPTRWVAGTPETVPVAAAAVLLEVHRTRTVDVTNDSLHVGYLTVAAESDADAPAVVRFLDDLIVQARRDSAGIAWHAYGDDYPDLAGHAAGLTPGLTAIHDAWQDRTQRERGTAPLLDTSDDLGVPQWTLQSACTAATLDCPMGDTGVLGNAQLQALYEAAPAGPAVEGMACSALFRAGATALLAAHGKQLSWEELSVGRVLRAVAWDHFPDAFGSGVGHSSAR